MTMSAPAARPPGGDDPGQAIAAARKAQGLTQSELARQAAISLSLLRKIEQGNRPVTPGVRAALDAVLPVPASTGGAAGPERIAVALPQLSEVMDAYDIPPDLPHAIRPVAELRRLTSSATAWRLSSQYAKLAGLLPGLITDDAVTQIHQAARGKPRTVNNICVAALIATAVAGKNLVDHAAARAAITEITATD